MTGTTLRRFGVLLAILALAVFTACDRSATEPDDHFGTVDRVEVRDRATNTLYAESHGDHFDGEVPHIDVGEEIALNVHFFDVDGNEADLGGGEYELGIRYAELATEDVDGEEGIVEFYVHGDHADIEGVAVGETHIVFQIMHGNHSDFDTPALTIEVEDH